MSATTGIEWTDKTWNPIVGCSVVSPGCKLCYAMKFAGRRLQHVEAYKGLTQDSKAGPVWTGEVRQQSNVLFDPLSWRKPSRVFVNSMGDVFHEDVPDEWIDDVFAVMGVAQRHQFQLLTKRSARMRAYMSNPDTLKHVVNAAHSMGYIWQPDVWPLPNVWLGVSAEDQQRWNERVPDLIHTSAAVRFVSAEPLLGIIRADPYVQPYYNGKSQLQCIDWVIAGGESGQGARPMRPEWVRPLRDDCAFFGVPFFFKQWGEHDETGRKVGKKNAGRLLDGQLHDGFPNA